MTPHQRVARDGPQAALAELEQRFRLPLLRFFQRRTRTEHEAEDLVQEVFLRLAQQASLASIEDMQAYVFRVATNLLRDGARRAVTRRQWVHVDIDTALAEAKLSHRLIEEIEPERVLLARERGATLVAVLAELDDRRREIFILHRLERMRQAEIAARLGITVSAVEKHIVKATALISRRLGGRP